MRSAEEFEEVDRLTRWGMSDRAVANLTGIPKPTIREWRRRGRTGLRGPNRSRQEFDEVDRLIRWEMNDCAISRLTGIPRGTIRDWRRGKVRSKRRLSDCPICGEGNLDPGWYAYLLGLYLGDGCLSEHPRGVFRLRITLDKRYPGIIDECRRAISAARSGSAMKVGITQLEGCVEVGAYWKHWPCLFPQHGRGPKHLRPIWLANWQQEIVKRYPDRLLRGLIHSDGCRFTNTVKVRGRKYAYPRYQFTNNSKDIRDIFCRASDDYGIAWRQSNWKTISVSRGPDVARVDEIVGPKA